jgi:DNA sulfur modification protein DndB
MDPYVYEFTAIRGVQAGRAYYVAMCPLRLVARLFRFDDDEVPAPMRAQRVLNRARIPEIARYVSENPLEYVFSSLCASVDGEVEFRPTDTGAAFSSVGILRISMSSKILINDGQHRRAALEEAVRLRPELGDETISVVLFVDRGLARSQQMFADLNLHAIRPTRSLGVLYDHRDRLSEITRQLISEITYFRGLTELERTTISNRSIKLFTLSSVYQATAELLGGVGATSDSDLSLAIRFWNEVGRYMPDWQRAAKREVSSAELRRDYIHSHGVTLQALGIAGNQAIAINPAGWPKLLKKLKDIDWSRGNRELWEGRAMIGGRLSKSRNNVVLVANVILKTMGIPLTAEGEKVELSLNGIAA